ncbi:MAG: UDP-N-acetylmuramoyl-tripeptide--D-alanyl-D-alanine ligase [Gluconacetobacter diazotrophicus]|nr:UDP-N-acetylmuramoyl-tripeptide--D-alanyl-D-alanine ligase [Gluconacetobacter diazotrophicus]
MTEPLWTATALADATSGCWGQEGEPPAAIAGISIDTRTVKAGELFVALRSDTGNGHAFAAGALDRGAAAVLVDDDALLAPGFARDPRVLSVPDTFAALQALGRAGRARFGGKVVAVTGSVGKTTTKEMLRLALGALGPVHAAEGSHNNHWGVPLTLARLPASAAFCVCEIGMNHPGEIAPLAALARPHVAIVTTVAATHIGHMGSLEAIAAEKAAIFGALEPGGTALFPAEVPHATVLEAAAAAAKARTVRFGIDAVVPHATVYAHVPFEGGSIGSAVMHDGPSTYLRIRAPGRHLMENALAVICAVHALGGDIHAAAEALQGFRPGAGRGLVRSLPNGAVLLDESYNASGASVRAAFEVLRLNPASVAGGRRIAVLGDMRELGPFSRAEHEALAEPAAEAAELVFCAGPESRFLFDRLPEMRRGAHAATAAALAPVVVATLRAGDVVLVKGSYGSRMRDVVDALLAMPATPGEPVPDHPVPTA